jgi:catechol 2,3-dioxygenase-like lactoylglutathione lyase family enzyme
MFDDLLDEYERGALSRRQLVQGLLMAAFPAALGAQSALPPDPLRARNINHVHVVVKDMEESTAFYSKLLGGTVRELSPGLRRVFLPGEQTFNARISLDARTKSVGLDHIAFGIERFDAAETKAAINRVLPDVNVTLQGKQSCFVTDPNGIRVQLVAKDDAA